MRVLVAGATGVIGRELLPLLRERGDHVVAVARHARAVPAGVEFVEADVLDESAIGRAVAEAEPDAVVNLLTAIPQALNPRRFATEIEPTNRLRRSGTANLLSAAGDAYVVSESLTLFYDPAAGGDAVESQPLWDSGPKPIRDAVAAVHACEQQTLAAQGAVLRLGHLYGPGTHLAADGTLTAQIKAGKMPLAGDGRSTFSFVHAHDAATGVVAALESRARGIFNIVDDEPAPMNEWLPEVARMLGAPSPKSIPALAARLFGGAWGHAYMTALVGASNDHARTSLGWQPTRSSWRTGLAAELSTDSGKTSATGRS